MTLDDKGQITVRVTPRASRTRIEAGAAPGDPLRAYVTVPPEDGKANEAVRKLLAGRLGVAKTRLRLIRGAKSREKVFQLD